MKRYYVIDLRGFLWEPEIELIQALREEKLK